MRFQKFYDRPEWKKIRYKVLNRDNFRCLSCKRDDLPLEVDHIRPLSIYPELALTFTNLQTLCHNCNQGKSNVYFNDHRPHNVSEFIDESELAKLEKSIKAELTTASGRREMELMQLFTEIQKKKRSGISTADILAAVIHRVAAIELDGALGPSVRETETGIG